MMLLLINCVSPVYRLQRMIIYLKPSAAEQDSVTCRQAPRLSSTSQFQDISLVSEYLRPDLMYTCIRFRLFSLMTVLYSGSPLRGIISSPHHQLSPILLDYSGEADWCIWTTCDSRLLLAAGRDATIIPDCGVPMRAPHMQQCRDETGLP